MNNVFRQMKVKGMIACLAAGGMFAACGGTDNASTNNQAKLLVNPASLKISIPAANVTASSTDAANIPGNAVDGNLGTHWTGGAASGNQWIQFKLPSCYTVDFTNVSWYNGDQRQYTFTIDASKDNGATWTTVKTVTSAGTSAALVQTDFPDTAANMMRISSSGSNVSTKVSINDVEFWGSSGASCSATTTTTKATTTTTKATTTTTAGYKLVWSDEFNNGNIDTSKWSFEVNGGGGGNNELQYYTARSQNARIENNHLVIEARKEAYTGPDGTRQYTSARLTSRNKGDWLYGRMEASIKLPYGKGLWPAFWMLPTNNKYGSWAASGEIDIMEAVNLKAAGGNNIYGSIHYGGAWPNNTHTTLGISPSTSVADNYHLYAVEWEPTKIRWYVDNVLYSTQTNWSSAGGPYPAPFDQPFYTLLNVAVGGGWPGNPDASTVFPQRMEVDYVRVYQK